MRGAAVAVPVWIALLGLLPFTGLGVGACLLLATAGAAVAVLLTERLLAGRAREADGREAPGRRRARRRMGAPAAVALTLGVVLLVVYVIFVLRAA